MKVAFSGTAMWDGTHVDRKLLTALAHERGITVCCKVDWDTDLLVQGVPPGARSGRPRKTRKALDAEKLGTKVCSIEEFLNMFRENN